MVYEERRRPDSGCCKGLIWYAQSTEIQKCGLQKETILREKDQETDLVETSRMSKLNQVHKKPIPTEKIRYRINPIIDYIKTVKKIKVKRTRCITE